MNEWRPTKLHHDPPPHGLGRHPRRTSTSPAIDRAEKVIAAVPRELVRAEPYGLVMGFKAWSWLRHEVAGLGLYGTTIWEGVSYRKFKGYPVYVTTELPATEMRFMSIREILELGV